MGKMKEDKVKDEATVEAVAPLPGPAKKESKVKKLSHESRKRLASFGMLVILALGAGFAGGYFGTKNSNLSNASTEVQKQVISNESTLINSIAKDVGQSVVSVNVSGQTTSQNMFGYGQSQETSGAGSGVIITEDGIVMTNRHVVESGTTSVSITLSDGTELTDVEIIGRTSSSDPIDVAFLKIKDAKGKKLVPAKLADSSKVQVGDKVIAIGNALGQFQNTVTSGIISGYGRDIEAGDSSSYYTGNTETLQNLFQTDAAINPGNSGGPLVNVNSEVIGLNVAVADGQNIGFAIPINDIKSLIESVEKTGKLERPYLGVRYVSLTDEYAYYYNLDTKRGAYIAPTQGSTPSIVPNSPASKAGLKEKDIIVSVNDVKIDEKNSFVSVIGRFKVGEKVTLKVIRDGKEITINATLEASPQE